ncbi:hypothetical protein J4G08_16140 [Candidatus Poribacteria bacterium]|nr:hypothetical protein [Candidatus Poribacteria bacterium]
MQKKIKSLILQSYKRQITICALVMMTLMLCACGSKVARVSIPIKVQSEIDIDTYSNFAVLPFVSEKNATKLDGIPVKTGNEIAEILRSGLTRQKHFKVVNKQETTRLMTGEEVGEEWLVNTERLSELGRYFEVKGIIVGSYQFKTDTRPRRYYGERYSTRQQRYVMDYQDYMQKTYILALRVIIIDVDTEKIIWDEAYLQKTAEAHSIGSFVFSQMAPQETTLRELSKRAAYEFTRDISPHYEQEDRFLMR